MSDHRLETGQTERRFVPLTKLELRESDDGEARGIRGLGIPAGVTADIGPFTEEISRAAITDAMERGWDIRGLFNHDPNFVLGRTGSGTMKTEDREDGMWFDIPEMPESRADVLEAIQRGDVDGNSFSFTVPEDGDDWDHSGDKPHRTISRFGRLYDLGPVTFPAYEGQTVVSARAMVHVTGDEEARAEETAPPETDETADDGQMHDTETEPTVDEALKARQRKTQLLKAQLDAE